MAEALLELEKDVFIQIIINSYWLTNRKLSWGVLDVVQVFLAVVQVDQDMVHVLGDINKVLGDLVVLHALLGLLRSDCGNYDFVEYEGIIRI